MLPACSAGRSRAASLAARETFSPLCPPSTSQPSPEPTSLSCCLHPMKKASSCFPFLRQLRLYRTRLPLCWAFPNLHSPENWPKWLKVPRGQCWMSLQGTKIAIWQPCTKRPGLGARVPHLRSLNIPAQHAGAAEVLSGGFRKANELLSVQKDLPEPWPPFGGLPKPSWLGILSRLQLQR